jgi:hypothetical protein
MLTETPGAALAQDDEIWPADAGLVLSALDAASSLGGSEEERRSQPRHSYRVRAKLRLFSDPAGTKPWTLYTRDINHRGLGFITRHRLPLGYGGTVELLGPSGRTVAAHCTLFRCREAAPGWYEGALYFNREQWVFASEVDD